MAKKSNLTELPFQWTSIVKPMLAGAAIGFLVISIFVFGADNYNPEWPDNWRVRPLILTPIAAAMGGAFFAFLGPLRKQGGWKTALGYILGMIGFIVALWIGIVLGLDGTMWN